MTTDTLCLDIYFLHRRRPLNTFHCQSLMWHRGQHPLAWVNLVIDRAFITLEVAYGPSWIEKLHMLPVNWSPCRKGGERPWFYCMGCGRNVAKLYLGPGARFACRRCCRLLYPSQYDPVSERAQAKADKVLARLGRPSGSRFPLIRPKGMHRKTYERLLMEYGYWATTATEALADEMGVLAKRLDTRARTRGLARPAKPV